MPGKRNVNLGNGNLLGCYASISGDLLLTFRENVSVPSSGFKNKKKKPDNGNDRFSRNVGKELPLLAA